MEKENERQRRKSYGFAIRSYMCKGTDGIAKVESKKAKLSPGASSRAVDKELLSGETHQLGRY